MRSGLFRGSGVALATPFAQQGIDYERLDALIEFQIGSGTDALIVLGTTGEPSTIPLAEREQLIERALQTTGGRVPVIMGTASNSTQTAIELSRRAQQLGVDALLIVTPYYNRPSQQGLVAHYLAIADSVSMPIILYNVPTRTGVNLSSQSVARLSQHENIVALKEANGDLVQLMETIDRCEGRIDIYSGDDNMVVPMMALGARGVISVAANIIPRQMHDMVISYLVGDLDRARALQIRYLPLIRLLFVEPNPQPLKAAMRLMGLDGGQLRPPLAQITEHNLALLREEMARMGLLPD